MDPKVPQKESIIANRLSNQHGIFPWQPTRLFFFTGHSPTIFWEFGDDSLLEKCDYKSFNE